MASKPRNKQFFGKKNFAHQIINVINKWNVKYFHRKPQKYPKQLNSRKFLFKKKTFARQLQNETSRNLWWFKNLASLIPVLDSLLHLINFPKKLLTISWLDIWRTISLCSLTLNVVVHLEGTIVPFCYANSKPKCCLFLICTVWLEMFYNHYIVSQLVGVHFSGSVLGHGHFGLTSLIPRHLQIGPKNFL